MASNNYCLPKVSELAGVSGRPAWTCLLGRKAAAREKGSPSVQAVFQLLSESLLLMSH